PCDEDDDNDTVLDGQDNCQLVSNIDQTDTDENGIGIACDPQEFQREIKELRQVKFKRAEPEIYPLPEPCPACDSLVLGNPLEQVISLELATDFYARIIDSDGLTVAQSVTTGPIQSLIFQPELTSFAGAGNTAASVLHPTATMPNTIAPDPTRSRL